MPEKPYCAVCGKAVPKRGAKKFCSRECFYESMRVRRAGRLCACGCGELLQSNLKHAKYLPHHSQKVQHGPQPYLATGINRWIVRARDGSSVYWYRVVAQNKLGRPLEPDEHVHHVDGDKADDRPENLQVLSRGEHLRLHWESWRIDPEFALKRQLGRARARRE